MITVVSFPTVEAREANNREGAAVLGEADTREKLQALASAHHPADGALGYFDGGRELNYHAAFSHVQQLEALAERFQELALAREHGVQGQFDHWSG